MTAQAIAWAVVFLLCGGWLAAAMDHAVVDRLAGRPPSGVWLTPLLAPLHAAAADLLRPVVHTEHPDRLNSALAPLLYLTLAAAGVAVVPLSASGAIADLPAGIVWWGAVESLTVVAVFLHGWSANSALPQIAAYRYVAIGLPVMLVSMFVLIAAALPAKSLSVSTIVASQADLWNVVRQPLGLPLFLLLGLSLSLRGPFNQGDSADLAGGTEAERSGAARALWRGARLAMAVSFAAMASALFLGGPLGPWLPGALWMVLKTAFVLALLVAATHAFARLTPSRLLTLLWTVLLPLSFAGLVGAGLLAAG